MRGRDTDSEASSLFNRLADEVCAELDAERGGVPPVVAAHRVYSLLQDHERSVPGSPAERVIRTAAVDGLQKRIRDRLKVEERPVPIGSGKPPIHVKSRIAVRRTAANGQRLQQLTLWWTATPREFLAYVDGLRNQRDRLTEELTGYDAVARVVEQHMDAPTVKDALERGGINPDHLAGPLAAG